jgi:hypothetical protein
MADAAQLTKEINFLREQAALERQSDPRGVASTATIGRLGDALYAREKLDPGAQDRELAARASSPKKPDGTPVSSEGTNSSIPSGVAERKTESAPPRATDQLKNGETRQETNAKTTASSAKKNLPALVRNPMEVFASSNVLWTMACLTPQQFNDPRLYRSTPGALKNLVFSSAGRFDADRVSTFFGSPEFYINNFVMQTVIGANEATGNSNAVKFSFDIIEPHSMGLLLQSMQNAAIKAGYLSYLDNAPFVLRMDIQGFNELGQNLSTIKPKFFVMKLSSTKFVVNEGGSVYKVEAIPYNHQAFSDAINTTYSDVKISASGNGHVFDILSGSSTSLMAYLNKNEEKLLAEGKISVKDEYVIQFPILSSDWQSSAGNQAEIKKATVDPNAPATNRTAVQASMIKTDPQLLDKNSIASASLGFDQKSGGRAVFKRAGDQYDEKTGVLKRDGMTIDPKTRAFQFGQSQSLTSIINQVILSSEYATEALEPKFLTPQGFIKWFKLDIQMELLKFDEVIGDYAKKITYRVVPYLVHQSIFANATSAPVGYAELMKSVVKEYQYIYTGQNVDILSFNIDINNLFYAGANPKPEAEAAKTGNQDQKAAEDRPSSTKTGKGPATEVQSAQTGRARPKRDPRLLKGFKGGSENKSVEQNVAENFQEAFISGSSADLVTINLEVLGDPYWLIDSGMSNYFTGAASPTAQITDDGTMNYESGNVYIYISLRTPADVNTLTGLYDFSIAGKESPFGGIYRVVTCENQFNDGNWKQKLKCIRMPGPQGPEVNETITGDKPSVIDKQSTSATEIGDKEPPKTSPIDSSGSNTASNTGAGTNTAAGGNNAASNTRTTTTSNLPPRVVGFRYYRDLGQN